MQGGTAIIETVAKARKPRTHTHMVKLVDHFNDLTRFLPCDPNERASYVIRITPYASADVLARKLRSALLTVRLEFVDWWFPYDSTADGKGLSEFVEEEKICEEAEEDNREDEAVVEAMRHYPRASLGRRDN